LLHTHIFFDALANLGGADIQCTDGDLSELALRGAWALHDDNLDNLLNRICSVPLGELLCGIATEDERKCIAWINHPKLIDSVNCIGWARAIDFNIDDRDLGLQVVAEVIQSGLAHCHTIGAAGDRRVIAQTRLARRNEKE